MTNDGLSDNAVEQINDFIENFLSETDLTIFNVGDYFRFNTEFEVLGCVLCDKCNRPLVIHEKMTTGVCRGTRKTKRDGATLCEILTNNKAIQREIRFIVAELKVKKRKDEQ